jgi:hypothetical protein
MCSLSFADSKSSSPSMRVVIFMGLPLGQI